MTKQKRPQNLPQRNKKSHKRKKKLRKERKQKNNSLIINKA